MASMVAPEAETYLLNNRNQDERDRLDNQHVFAQCLLGNNIVNPSIDKSKMNAVADIATGTGAWLLHAFKELGTPGTTDRNFVGFDISAAQFPNQQTRNLSFILHDATEPFAREHIGAYDLVHVRFLILALPVSAYAGFIRNVVALLKPGGLIQWTDFDLSDMKPQTDAAFDESVDIVRKAIKKNSMALDTPGQVRKEFEEAGLLDVKRTDYQTDSGRVPFELYVEWYDSLVKILIRHLLTRDVPPDKHDELEAKAEHGALAAKRAHEKGLRFRISLGDVVARKPLW